MVGKKEAGQQPAIELNVPIAATPPASAAGDFAPPTESKPLALVLVFAFIGGLILNVMPCVLPVIALKILGFVQQSKETPQQVRRLGLIYALGVLVSFLVLAVLVIIVKEAGRVPSWGMQFQKLQFLIPMTILVLLVALNLFGIFEVTLSGRAMGAASELASRAGAAGAFFNGVLATLLATPCTAPFLGVALGFAFTQPSAVILLTLLAVGFGLAAPYVVLSWRPNWLKFLPRPGAWMEKFKIAMGFPMLATVVWLFKLTLNHFSKSDVFWFGVVLVALAMSAWIWGEFVQRGRKRRWLGIAASFRGKLTNGVGRHHVVSEHSLRSFSVEKVPEIMNHRGIGMHDSGNSAGIQLLRLTRSDQDQVGVRDPHRYFGELALHFVKDHPQILWIELVKLNPLREDPIWIENLGRPVVKLRGEKAGDTGDPWIRRFGDDDIVLFARDIHVVSRIVEDHMDLRVFVALPVDVGKPSVGAKHCRLDLNAVDVFNVIDSCNRANRHTRTVANDERRLGIRMIKGRQPSHG